MKKYLLNVAVVLIGTLGAFSNTSSGRDITGLLEGRVKVAETGESLSGVTVVVVGTGLACVTDSAGYYQINGVRAGLYDIKFQLIGYQTKTILKVTILPDFRTRIDADLKQSLVEMEPIEIRAERPLIQKDNASSAYQLSGQQMNLLPVTRLNDAVTLMPGVTREGNVRGGKTNEVIYLLDGLPMQDVIAGGNPVALPKSTAAAMTVWTGGFDAEYGNALSGVVNVVTRSGSPVSQFELRYGRDHWLSDNIVQQTNKESELELLASGPIVDNRLSVLSVNNYTASDTRWWQDLQHFFSSPVSRDFTGLTRLEYTPASTTRLVLQGVYSLQRWRDYEFRWRYNLTGLPEREKDLYRANVMFTRAISNQSFYSLALGYSSQRSHIGPESKDQLPLMPYQYDVALRYIVGGAENWWAETRQRILTAKADYTLQSFSFHTFKLGAEINQYDIYGDIVKYEPQLTYFAKPIQSAPLLNYSNFYQYYPRTGSAFLQDKIEFTSDGAILSFGIRWDFLDPAAERPVVEYIPTRPGEFQQQVTGKVKAALKQQLSPRFSITMPVGPSGYIFANYGRYIQFPLFDYLYSGITPTQLEYGSKNVLAGNPDLEPERLSSWETGIRHQVGKSWMVSMAYFQKKVSDQIDAKTLVPFKSKYAGDFGFASYVNIDDSESKGFEIVLTRENSEWLNGFVSYTNMITEGLSEQANQNVNIAQWGFAVPASHYPLSWDQRHTIKINMNAKLPWEMETDLAAEYHSPRPYTFYPTKDGITPIDTSRVFSPNNRRMSEVYIVDLKIQKIFRIRSLQKVELAIYADARNIFNAKNVLWMDSNGRIGGELGDPGAYDTPRRVRLGIIARF